MGAFSKTPCVLFRCLILSLGLLHPLASHAQSDWCRCPGGAVFQPGMVNYKGNSDRELVTRIEMKKADPDHRCEAAWIGDANFEWVVDAVSEMAIRKAREHIPGRDNLSWGKFVQAAVNRRSLGELAGK